MKTIKSKISFGVIFMFTVIVLLSVLGVVFINKLAQQSKGTIIDNYASVDYSMKMIESLDDIHDFQLVQISSAKEADTSGITIYHAAKNIFENNLRSETNNITEKGEAELVSRLQNAYHEYMDNYEQFWEKRNQSDKNISEFNHKYLLLRKIIFGIYQVNMSAINFKSSKLQATADSVIIYMLIVAAISILVSFSFIFTFPSKIVEPLKELTEKIKSISERNYEQKLEISSDGELGELSKAFNVMVERLKLYEAKQIDRLLFEQKRLESVVHSFEDGIIFVDENKEVVLVNDTILQITGLKEKDILHRSITGVANQNDLIREIYKSINIKTLEEEAEIKPIRIARDGKESFFNIESEKIVTYSESEKKEAFIGNLILLRNITKFQERDTAKTNLLATVSHELKTPLSSINLSLRLLDDKRFGELNSDQKEVVNSLKQQSNRLSRVINELLDYSQIETGNIKLKFSSVKPDEVLDIGMTALMMQVSEKNLNLQTYIEDNLPEIRVDLEKLVFVFINILNNAVRFSPNGSEINIEVRKVDSDVEFSIKDNGQGISKEDCDKLFQRFTQVGNKSKRGWGLGLAISKEFMQAQNGKLRVESELGKGSKFTFSVPGIV